MYDVSVVRLWRASREMPRSGDRLGFASLEDLFALAENETTSSFWTQSTRKLKGDDMSKGPDEVW